LHILDDQYDILLWKWATDNRKIINLKNINYEVITERYQFTLTYD